MAIDGHARLGGERKPNFSKRDVKKSVQRLNAKPRAESCEIEQFLKAKKRID
jgi:hypothetical protein